MSTSLDLIKLRCGHRVFRIEDPRHIGRVESVHPTMTVTVKWQDSGWIEQMIPFRELVRV